MQRFAGGAAVFVGGKDDQAIARRQVGAGEPPLAGVGEIVRERPVQQVDGVAGDIGDLDPIGMFAVLIDDAAEVAGEELGDDDGSAEGAGRLKNQHQQRR